MTRYSKQRIESMTEPQTKNPIFLILYPLILIGLVVGGLFAYGEYENQQFLKAEQNYELVQVANYAGPSAEVDGEPVLTYEWRRKKDRDRRRPETNSDSLPKPETVKPPRRRERILFNPNRKRLVDGSRFKAVGQGLMWLAGGLLLLSMVGLHIKTKWIG